MKSPSNDHSIDTVFIEALRVETVIGVLDWERRIRQTVVLDVELEFDIARAAASDAIADALDYGTVAARLTTYVQSVRFQLIETLAERCAEVLLAEFPVRTLTLRVSKPGAVSNAATVGVRITRNAARSEMPASLTPNPA